MFTKMPNVRPRALKKQKGIAIFSVILAIVFIMGAIAAVFVSSSSLSGSSSGQNFKVMASGVVNQGVTLVSAFQNMEAKGNSASAITYDMNTVTGLFNPTVGSTSYQRPSASYFSGAPVAVPSVRQSWVYKGSLLTANNVGTAAAETSAFVLRGLALKVCQEINTYLYQSPTIPASAKTAALFVADAATDAVTPITDVSALDLSGVAAINRWSSGCVSTTEGEYVYFTVAEPG
jgi:hypothetical protein